MSSRIGLISLLASLALVASCFNPSLDDPAGGYRCTEDGDCPPNMACDKPAKTCRDKPLTDMGPGVEAGQPDLKLTDSTPPDNALQSDMSLCGNDTIDKGEQCDGKKLGGATCKDQGRPICVKCLISLSPCYSLTPGTKDVAILAAKSEALPTGAFHLSTNSVVVLWDDPYSSGNNKQELSMQKLLAVGLSPQLGGYGKNITSTPNAIEHMPAMTTLGKETLAVWSDNRNGTDDIYAGRINPAGNIEKNDQSGVKVYGDTSYLRYPAVACNKAGTSCLVVWYDGSSSYSQIRGEILHYKTGYLIPNGSSKPLAISTQNTAKNSWPAIATDGTDYLVVWTLTRGTVQNIYGRKVFGSGNLPATAEKLIGGITKGTASYASMGYLPSTGRYMLAWADRRNSTYDIYGARVDKDGTVMKADASGLPVATGKTYSRYPEMACNNDTCLVVFPSGTSLSTPVFIAGVRLEDNKTSMVVVDSPPIVLAKATDYYIGAPWPLRDASNNFIVVWRDNSNAGSSSLKSLLFKP